MDKMSAGEWQTVGKQSTISKVFNTEKQFEDGVLGSENAVAIGRIVSLAEEAEDPLRAVLEASWFAVLSQTELSPQSLSEVLDVLDFVVHRAAPSNDLEKFLVRTLEHRELRSALVGLLEAECYEHDDILIICRYIALIRTCWTRPRAPIFERIACDFYRRFRKKEHTSADTESFAVLTDCVDKLLEKYAVEDFEEKFIAGYPSGYSPPDDFRLIPSYPRTQDVVGELPFLRPNIEKGPFRSLEDYLDVHYRLLREEYISALRNGIRDLRRGSFSHDLVSFTAARVGDNNVVDEFGTITFKMTSNHGKLQEFKTGVLVALPREGLNGFIYLTCLDVEGGYVKLEFCDSNDSLTLKSSDSHQLLLLKSAYYEAFRHTLDALKMIAELPFQSSIVGCEIDDTVPGHWRRVDRKGLMNENIRLMNRSQFEAFSQTMSRRVCLIQGPPGTGKTFVGLRIVESILKHKVTETPVLVVCYTNHALDQFLEGMLYFTRSIVRIGGRSKSEKLAPYSFENLKIEMQHKTWLNAEDRKKRNACYDRMVKNRKKLKETEALLGVIEGRTLFRRSEIIKLSDEFAKLPDLPEFLEVSTLCQGAIARNDFIEGSSKSSDDPIEAYIGARMSSGDILEKAIADMMQKIRPLNRYAFGRVSQKLMYKYFNEGEKPRQPLTLDEKWRFYATLHWKKVLENPNSGLNKDDLSDPSKFEEKRQNTKKRLAEAHNRCSNKLAEDANVVNRLRATQSAAMLRSKRIIGLTTTGAAKRRELLQELDCNIIVVEEAAEILESHLVAILPRKTQQIILIGDHKQLSPCINNYRLERSFNFGVSLFERLVNNGMPYVTLNVQHRMRDEFLKLLVPHIYDNITSSPRVNELDSIRGMSKDLQFLSHKCSERVNGSHSASKSNHFEATMICALLEHLAHQGYGSRQIVVLCAYAGQQSHVYDLLRRSNPGVRVSTIDDYQGEESDIVIVSFVRCNAQNEIGFLAKSNRVCVALSRARKGLFCFGDFVSYAKRSPVWEAILNTLNEMGAVNGHLELRCPTHGTMAQVRTPEEFGQQMPHGCCLKACDSLLECDHRCSQPCHVGPHPTCRKTCLYVHPDCGHRCRKSCFQEHGACGEIVPKVLACGHTDNGPCAMPSNSLQCRERCQKELECGHRCGSLCSMPCTQNCMVEVPITRDCDHHAVVACGAQEQGRSQSFCKIKVEAQLTCGHSANVRCRLTLRMDLLTASCMTKVANVVLPCGHVKTMSCRENQNLEVYSCKQPVEVELVCGHRRLLDCYLSTNESAIIDETFKCEIPVEAIATCGHRVSTACKLSPNAAQFCTETVEVELACGHVCLTMCLRARNEVDLRRMMLACSEQIFIEASCSHPVEVACGKRYDEARLLSLCEIILSVTSPCGHEVSVVCPSSRSPYFVRKLCPVGRTETLGCCHTMDVRCSDLRSVEEISGDCKEKIENVLKCGHKVDQVCRGTLGDLNVKCNQPCEFVHRCGHTCTGNCTKCRGGQRHRPCRSDCSKTLPCGHLCKGKCEQRCGPCEAPCQRLCGHGHCEKKCGEPCSSRSQTCRRKGVDHCPHQSCAAKTCWECDCEPCEQKCTKKHEKCDHLCEGLCNEPCVPCFRCKPKRMKALFGLVELSGKFLQIPGCNHVVDAEVMDRVMASWTVGTPRCINCNEDVPGVWRRYNYVYNRIYRKSLCDAKRHRDAEHAHEDLLAEINNFRAGILISELKEDTKDREMVRYHASQILADLTTRLKRANSEDVLLCDLVFQVLKSLVELCGALSRNKPCFVGSRAVREKTFLLTRDTFEDLSDMVGENEDSESPLSVSVLDDISTQALRLKFVAMLPLVAKSVQTQLLDLIFAEGRFSVISASALLKASNSKLKVEPFYKV